MRGDLRPRSRGRRAGREVEDIVARLDGATPGERLVDFFVRTGPFGDGFGAAGDGLSLAHLREHPHGLGFGPMRAHLPGLLKTPGATLELESALIDAELEAAAGAFREPGAELLLIGRREFHSNDSWMHNLPALSGCAQRCTLRMHRTDAAARGLDDGATVTVRSAVGAVAVRLEIHDEMGPGVVRLPHGYGHDRPGIRLARTQRQAGVSANDRAHRCAERQCRAEWHPGDGLDAVSASAPACARDDSKATVHWVPCAPAPVLRAPVLMHVPARSRRGALNDE